MRAKIVGMIVLMGIMALATSFAPLQQAAVQDVVPHQLTAEEADCLVGGKATCIDVAVNTAEECLADAGLTTEDLDNNIYNAIVGGICAGSGVVAGLSCTWEWFTGLFG